ncbi:MAG: TetR family transcriptional regulator [Clostridia bacterium]|nr:TetR family transcriptional regulator [Clostridia bacterium]
MKNQTKKHILASFNELLEKKDFDKITVEEVCARAEISKPTFYRYYRDKYDVMTYNFQLLFEEYFVLTEELDLHSFLEQMYPLPHGPLRHLLVQPQRAGRSGRAHRHVRRTDEGAAERSHRGPPETQRGPLR